MKAALLLFFCTLLAAAARSFEVCAQSIAEEQKATALKTTIGPRSWSILTMN